MENDSSVGFFGVNGGGWSLVMDTGTGRVKAVQLGSAGSTALCRNASNEISTCSSSARYKDNINTFTSGLELIRKLRPVSFNWKDGGIADMGLVAEEVNAVEPLLTSTNDQGEVEGVKYDRIGVVLINAVKEQQSQIEAQQREINELKQIVCELRPTAKVCLQK
ncbi:MAG: tail fiber domain-containing protein [Chloracidobacterium sp.]|nr:tail fiber domain-containing protein [Chloracidobacterium sp.]